MKYIYNIITAIALGYVGVACTDDPLIPDAGASSAEDFNIKEFSDGYSLCFNVTLDEFGGGMNTRATVEDATLAEWENYLDPEEYRVLFFDKDDNFLFESQTRWFTPLSTGSGNKTWRIAVPVFKYVRDIYDDKTPEDDDDIKLVPDYNWERIAEIMRTEPFKIAVLANRPTEVKVPNLSDWNSDDSRFEQLTENFAKNGPFWDATNSRATYDENDPKYEDKIKENVKNVFDLHHCQEDPLYYNKCYRNVTIEENGTKRTEFQYQGWYDFIMDWNNNHEFKGDENNPVDPLDIPLMGAVSGWISYNRERVVYNPDNITETPRHIRYYRLPHDVVNPDYHNPKELSGVNGIKKPEEGPQTPEENLYIPMYGIQLFDPITTWNKGTTYNISTQTGSQTGEYNYKNIFLLRSVVKLELRIPMYDNAGNYIDVDNSWAQIMLNNYMARCEPMDVSTPTNEIWENDHKNNCEWNTIRDYGLLYDAGKSGMTFKKRLSWFYGLWKEKNWWNFETYEKNGFSPKEGFDKKDIPTSHDYPHIFNPITQRTQFTFITDCYLPIENKNNYRQSFHRWVIYCGERNMNDLNNLGDMTGNKGYISGFRIPVCKKQKTDGKEEKDWPKIANSDCVYNIPITDYTKPNNPAKDYLIEKEWKDGKSNTEMVQRNRIYAVRNVPQSWADYCDAVVNATNKENYPFPLLRNHFYRITVSFGDREEDINVQVIDSEKRTVGGIVFN